MKRRWLVEVTTYCALLGVGLGLRIALAEIPNFAPVAALALFAGVFFRSWLVAASLPILVMGISDLFLGGYDYRLMALVHGSLALPALAGSFLRRFEIQSRSPSLHAAGVLGGSLISSGLFFLSSNFGVWLWSGIYESSLAGLLRCFVAAIPFFRFTLAGDLLFAVVLFGGYALVRGYVGESRRDSLAAVRITHPLSGDDSGCNSTQGAASM